MIFQKSGNTYPNLRAILDTLPDGRYRISEVRDTRNNQQNRLYFGLLTYIEKETGNGSEYLHELMKKNFLKGKKKLIKIGNQKKFVTKEITTTKLNTKQFSEYFSKVERFFLDVGYTLPDYNSPEFLSLCDTY